MIRATSFVFFMFLAACNADVLTSQDPRVAPPASDEPGFSLTASQTCGVAPPAELPVDPTESSDVTLQSLAERLAGDGIDGWVHAAVPELGEYVFSYRKPGEFFAHMEMAMIPANAEVQSVLAKLIRNDKIHIVGTFVNEVSPLGHILVTEVDVVKKFQPKVDVSGHEYSVTLADLAQDLKGKDALYGIVHAQTTSGGVLVIDYEDVVLPIFVSEPHREAAKALYRGDVVGIAYSAREVPHQPLHLETDAKVEKAIEVYDHMVWCNGREATLTGELVLYEESPQISIDVFALRHTDANGMQRNWTLIDFDDMEAFEAIQEKVAAAWNEHKAQAVVGRNFQINPKVRVTAKGIMNVVSPSQANPQIDLDGPDSLTIEILP